MTVDWIVSSMPVAYTTALDAMARRAEAIRDGQAPETVWLLEHPPLYTAGTSTDMRDYFGGNDLPVHRTGRGGQLTYHGPGQRIVYVMLDLGRRGRDLRRFMADLEAWIITTLAEFGVRGEVREGRIGIWVTGGETADRAGECKIAALGLRVRKWVSLHGLAINVHPDLSYYRHIVPCGISDYGVTSLHDLGIAVELAEIDAVLRNTFGGHFDNATLVDTPDTVLL
ncbi:MAG: lipoyl(octanoyl) transferase LipB [Rhodobacteraceae bacterium]|nr:lipoyl(octanoyl) transferase LipB [Paracoccaceae bacterium]